MILDHRLFGGHSIAKVRIRHHVFLRGSMVAEHHVSSMLDIFSDFSSLRLNEGKSLVVDIGVSLEE